MIPEPEDRPEDEVLVHAGPDRTLVARRGELWKVLESGSLAAAHREVELGRALAGTGVARYLQARQEPGTGRPVVVMAHHGGVDLEGDVARRGPWSLRAALRLVGRLGRILSALHGSRTAPAPHGVVHGDVKPGNVLVERGAFGADPSGEGHGVVLLDLEHARAIDASNGAGEGFSGGSRGWAPPEAERGAEPCPGFDAYGLGTVLHYVLFARGPGQAPPPQAVLPEAVAELLAGLLEADPARRWPVDEAVRRAETAAGDTDERDERALAVALVGDGTPPLPELPAADAEMLDRARGLAAVLTATGEVLDRHPACPAALERRAEARARVAGLLPELPPAEQELRREGAFAAARALLEAGCDVARATLAIPGSLQVPGTSPRLLNPLQRTPLAYLEAALATLAAAEAEHRARLAELDGAVAALDLAAAGAIVDGLAHEHGGASELVARSRDRLHELGFYLERLAGAATAVEQLEEELDLLGRPRSLEQVHELILRSARQTGGDGHRRSTGLRSLQRTLHDLEHAFPATAEVTQPAAAALDRGLATLSDEAWERIAEAENKLTSTPVPVRLLQSILNRLDGWRMAEALVDRPGRSRTELLDAIERVRLQVDQARATRDRIASGAEAAMARGHWTTALYEMQRAVDRFATEEEGDRGGQPELADRLELARRRKDELERAMHRNVELASGYAALVDRPEATSEERRHVLEERRRVLQFLIDHLHEERGGRYRQDLREVDVLIVQEKVGQAEGLLDRSDDPGEWIRIARQTLDLLLEAASRDRESGRVQRMIEHWQHRLEHAQREVDRREEERRRTERERRRRGWLRGAAVAVGVLVLGLAWQVSQVLAANDPAERLARSLQGARTWSWEIVDGRLQFPRVQALAELNAFARTVDAHGDLLTPRTLATTRELVDAVGALAEDPGPRSTAAVAAGLKAFDQNLGEAAIAQVLRGPLEEFGCAAWSTAACVLATSPVDASPLLELRLAHCPTPPDLLHALR